MDATAADQRLDPFPLHHDDQVSCFFDTDYDCGGEATLIGLLGTTTSSAANSSSSSAAAVDDESPSSSISYVGLATAALRGREKLVFCYSQAAAAVEEGEGEEASSGGIRFRCGVPQALSLKLDYDWIMSAWSDKGPLFIDGEAPQVVPEYYHTQASDSVFVELDCMGNSPSSSSSLWRVPEDDGIDLTATEKAGSREARVMRYKKKRQNRIFSKRIRYEVRKLNADKRPRMKGRFVKRKDKS